MTREHIIPKSIINLFQSANQTDGMQFIPKSGGKYIDGESTIKDVCATCNNEILGRLDEYASTKFAPQCIELMEEGQTRRLEYDYALLARWLLKIAFNSSRVSNSDTELLKPYREFIKGNSKLPKRLTIFATAIKPYHLSQEHQVQFEEKYGFRETVLYPQLFRISQILIPGQIGTPAVTRSFSLRSIMIVLLLGTKKMPEYQFKSLIRDFLVYYPEAKRVNPFGNSVTVTTGMRNAWDVFQYHALLYPHLYGDQGE